MLTLDQARAGIGRSVVYTSPGDWGTEAGVITSVNDTYVFVRYGADKGSKATAPHLLAFEMEAAS